MTFDQYVMQIMTLDLDSEKHTVFLFRQLSLLRNTPNEIAMKILLQRVFNLKLIGESEYGL